MHSFEGRLLARLFGFSCMFFVVADDVARAFEGIGLAQALLRASCLVVV